MCPARRTCFVTVLHLLCGHLLRASADFTTVPSSLTVGVREEAVFQCRYPGASIYWRVNGQPVAVSDSITVTSSGEQALDTLTIRALPEYNGTEVVCVALLSNFSIRSALPVHLLIDFSRNTSITGPPDGFTISPNDQTVPIGLLAVFTCQHNFTYIFWRVNGEAVRGNTTHSPGAVVSGSNIMFTLSITAEPEFNNSLVECEAIDLGQRETAQLRVQGLLSLERIRSTYMNYSESHILRWEPAFSLNITNVEPDVIYIVELYRLNTTCFYQSLISLVATSETSFVFFAPPYPHEVIITPRNNVEGARNGTSSIYSVTDYISLDIVTTIVEVNDTDLTQVALHVSGIISGAEGIVPASFSIELETIDGSVKEDAQILTCHCLVNDAKNVLRPACPVQSERLWLYQVHDSNCSDGRVVSNEILSTHFVQNITVNPVTPNQLTVSGDLISSKVQGFFVIAYVINGTESDDVRYGVARSRPANIETAEINLSLSGGVAYAISVFSVNETGLPVSKSAYFTQTALIDGHINDKVTQNEQNNLHSVFIDEDNGSCSGLLVTCTFADDASSGCVAVVHKRVNKLFNSTYGLLNIDVHLFAISTGSRTASGCLPNITSNMYHVAVFSYANGTIGKQIFRDDSDLSSGQNLKLFISTGITAVVVAGGLIVMATIIGMLIVKKRATNQLEPERPPVHASIEMKHCGAYEMRTLGQKKVIMKKNQAYETVLTQSRT